MRRKLFFLCVFVSCHKGPNTGASSVTEGVPTADAASSAVETVLSARCQPTERSLTLDELRDGSGLDVEMGDAVAYGDRYAVSFLHRTPAGRLAAVALLDAQASGARIVDLVPALGDAPPPRLAVCGNALVAVSFGVSGAVAGGGQLVVSVVDPSQAQRPLLTIPQHRDDSLSFDFACTRGAAGLVVWDETAGARSGDSAPRGVVRGAAFQVGHPGLRVWDVSPPDSDAEMPRAVAQAGGFSVLWIARRPETPKGDAKEGVAAELAGMGTSAGEAMGEARTYGWLEMTPVDADAGVAGPPRRLTPTSGHISAYDAQPLEPSKDVVWVVARDDGESIDAAGGTLLRMRVRPEGAETPVVLPTDALGRGPPSFVGGPSPWLAWVSAREQLRLLPVGEGGEHDAKASVEDSLEEARPLLSLAEADRILVASTGDNSAQLRVFKCRR